MSGGSAPSRSERARDRLRAEIGRVVESGNCSGCGLCATLADQIHMELNADGYLRPVWDESVQSRSARVVDADVVRNFHSVCPGVGQRAPVATGLRRHAMLGPYVSAWAAHATDPTVRRAGSSGGVLTALSGWLVESGRASSVIGAGTTTAHPTQTIPVRLSTKEAALAVSGSRYAPVGVAALYDEASAAESTAFVGKPCEAYAVRQRAAQLRRQGSEMPLILSFFCAGVPSQTATDELARSLVGDREITALRYRGNGWPGKFSVRTADDQLAEISYEESWGKALGPRVQSRCKICPDGVGEHADIAVGDFWHADERGYPTFAESDGSSVAIARTRRGHETLLAAAAAGIVTLEPVELDEVARVQPLQVQRRRTIVPRLLGRLFAGHRVPLYRGYRFLRTEFRTADSASGFLREFVRTTRGSRRRALKEPRRSQT